MKRGPGHTLGGDRPIVLEEIEEYRSRGAKTEEPTEALESINKGPPVLEQLGGSKVKVREHAVCEGREGKLQRKASKKKVVNEEEVSFTRLIGYLQVYRFYPVINIDPRGLWDYSS